MLTRVRIWLRSAPVLMGVAVGLISLVPMLVDFSGAWGSVALVTGVWLSAYAVTLAALAQRVSRRGLREWRPRIVGTQAGPSIRRLIEARRVEIYGAELPLWLLAGSFCGAFQWVFFAWSARHVETAITTVVFEMWPVGFLLVRALVQRLASNETDKHWIRATDFLFVGAAGAGFALVIFSGRDPLNVDTHSLPVLGVLLAVVALGLATMGRVVSVTAGEKATTQTRSGEHDSPSDWDVVLSKASHSTVLVAAARVLAVVVLLPIGAVEIMFGGPRPSAVALAAGVGLGVVHALGSWFFLLANHASRSDTINSLGYGIPVLAVGWLWLFTDVALPDKPLFWAGVIGVVAVNMVLHLDPEGSGADASGVSGHGFRALVVSLWATGTLVLFRDRWLPAEMLQWGLGEYFALIGLGATVFVLILSFRQNRLSGREQEADRLTLHALCEIDVCRDRGLLDPPEHEELIQHLESIDSKRTIKQIGESYFEFRKHTLTAAAGRSPDDRERLRRLLRDVEVLTNLRQQGRNIAELAVMTLFAALVVVLSLLTRPAAPDRELSGWEGLGIEVFTMCFAAGIGFLVFDLLDRRLERDTPRLREVSPQSIAKNKQPPGWRLNLLSYSDPTASRVLSLLLGAAVIAAFVVLLQNKWL